VASAEEREVFATNEDQQKYSSDETMKQWGVSGADYMLGGIISSIADEVEEKRSCSTRWTSPSTSRDERQSGRDRRRSEVHRPSKMSM